MADTIYTGTDGRTYALSEDGKTLSVSGEGSMNSVYSELLHTANGNIDVSGVETLNIAEGITECGTVFNIKTIKGTVTFPTTFYRMRNIFNGSSSNPGGPDEIIIKYNSTGTFYFGGVQYCSNLKKIIFTSPTKITISGEMPYFGDGYHVTSIYSKDNCAKWNYGTGSSASGIKPYGYGQSNQNPHQFTIYGGEYSEDTTQKLTTPTKEIQCDSAIKDELGNRIATTYVRIPSNYVGYYRTNLVTITSFGEIIYSTSDYVKTQGDSTISNGTLTVTYSPGNLAGIKNRIVNVDENTLPSAGTTQTFSLAYNFIGWGTPTADTIFSQLCVNRTSTEQEISLYTRRRSNSRNDMVELIVRLEETTDDAKLILRKTVSDTTTETTIATL